MKGTATKPNRFWKQKPFPKSHSWTRHLFPSFSRSLSLSLLQHGLSRVHHFIKLQDVLYMSDLHFEGEGRAAVSWDERTPGWREKKGMRVKEKNNMQTCWVKSLLPNVWHSVWHPAAMLPLWCVGAVPVSYSFTGDTCLSFYSVCLLCVWQTTMMRSSLSTASTHFGAFLRVMFVERTCEDYSINSTLASSSCMQCS